MALQEGSALANLKATINKLNPSDAQSQPTAAHQLLQKAGSVAPSAANMHFLPQIISQPAKLTHSGSFHLRCGSAQIFSSGAIAAEHTLKTDRTDRHNSKSALTISLDRQDGDSSSAAPSASRVAFSADSRPITASSVGAYTGMQPVQAVLNAPAASQHFAATSHAALLSASLTIAPTASAHSIAATPASHRPMTANPAATEALQQARVRTDTGSSPGATNAALSDQADVKALQIEPSLTAGSSSSSSSAWSLSDPVGQIPTASVPTRFAAMPEGHRVLSRQTEFDSARWSTQQAGQANLPAQHDDLLFEFEVSVDKEQALPASQPESEVSFSALLPSAGGEDSGIKFWDNGVQAPERPLSPSLTPSAPQGNKQTATVQALPLVQLYGSQSIMSTVGFETSTAANSDSLQLCREVRIKALCHPTHMLQGPWDGYHDVLLSKQWDRSVVTDNDRTFEDRYPTFIWNRLEGKLSRMVYPPSLQDTQTGTLMLTQGLMYSMHVSKVLLPLASIKCSLCCLTATCYRLLMVAMQFSLVDTDIELTVQLWHQICILIPSIPYSVNSTGDSLSQDPDRVVMKYVRCLSSNIASLLCLFLGSVVLMLAC